MPDRAPPSRDDLLRAFPGRDSQFLTNRCVTVLRTIRRMLPELIPAKLSDRDRPEDRFTEWLELLGRSDLGRLGRLHLALRVAPPLLRGAGQEQSLDMVDPELAAEGTDDDELRLILSFHLDLPFESYLRDACLPVSTDSLTLRALVENTAPPHAPLINLLRALKDWARQIRTGHTHDLPKEFSQVIYNLAVALALVRGDGTLITSLSRARIEMNLHWSMARGWVDEHTRSVLRQALKRLKPAPAG
jgi:hypothetical protein